MKSDPKTARLNYKRKPNVSELMKFLSRFNEFDEGDVRKAIRQVMSKKGAGNYEPTPMGITGPEPEPAGTPRGIAGPKSDSNVSTWKHSETTPGNPQSDDYKEPVAPPEKQKRYSNDDAEDIDFKDTEAEPPRALGAPKKPRYKWRGPGKMDRLSEAFYDRQGMELDENDIKEIFKILLTPKAEPEPEPEEAPGEEEVKAEKQQILRQLKEMVRDIMTPGQRKALWRALQEETLSESLINKADINAIFKDASYLRSKPTGLGKVFKGFRKEQVSVDDLRQAWADGLSGDGTDGYSDDTRDIKRILKSFGFDDKEINKVFTQVFKTDDQEYDDVRDEPTASKTVQKIADLAKNKGVDKALLQFLEQEFADELGLGKKATYEDVRQIFTAIVNEERTGRTRLIREEERQHLGRSKK